jgi:hypothetical protein
MDHRETFSQNDVPARASVSTKLQPVERFSLSEKVFERRPSSQQPLELVSRHQHDGIFSATHALWALSQRKVHDFTKSVLGIREIPVHR